MITGKKGTPIYAGPEVYLASDEEGYTEKCDVWGGGLILYEMLKGEMLFKNVKVKHINIQDIPSTKGIMGFI
jgi:serine/threonine protein kinase